MQPTGGVSHKFETCDAISKAVKAGLGILGLQDASNCDSGSKRSGCFRGMEDCQQLQPTKEFVGL